MSKGKKKSTSTQTSTTTQTLNPWSQNTWQDQWNRVQGGFDSLSPVQAYSGRSMADFGDNSGDYMNPYTQDVIDTTMADITRMNDQRNAQTRGRAAASGAYGGSGVAVAEHLNNAEALRQMASTGANLRYQGFNDAASRFGADIDREYQDYVRQQEEERQRLAMQMGLFGAIPMLTKTSGTGTGTTTQTTNPGFLGTIGAVGNLAGGLFGANGAFPAAFSDIRLKEDIQLAGQREGHNWYRFRYVWDEPGTVREGVMAQEILQTRPDVVGEQDGYMTVDYNRLFEG